MYKNKAKDEVGSNYTALLTALGSDKPVSVDIPNPSLPTAQQGAVQAQPQPGQVPPSSEPGASFQNPYRANRISILAFSQPPSSEGTASLHDYVTSVQILDGYLNIAVRGAFDQSQTGFRGPTNLVKSASPISDPATQAMESVALASFLGMKKVAIWVVAGCEKQRGIMTAISVNQ